VRLVADESIDRPIVERLRRRDHEVVFVAELDPGLPDDAVLALANDRNALLLTGDKDFGELVFRLGKVTAGVVLVRLAGLKPQRKAAIVEASVTRYRRELSGAFTVIAPGGVRIRKVRGAEAEH
jgi:predicted nuclease of predicted toxin-antitoxin system